MPSWRISMWPVCVLRLSDLAAHSAQTRKENLSLKDLVEAEDSLHFGGWHRLDVVLYDVGGSLFTLNISTDL